MLLAAAAMALTLTLLRPYPFTRYEQLGPRADCEESLRLAIGLRDLPRLARYLALGVERGLTKRNSQVFYAATELHELLVAEGAAQARSAAVGLHDDAPPADPAAHAAAAAADSAASAAGGAAPPPVAVRPQREKTEDVRLRLNDALSAFIEPVRCLVITPLHLHARCVARYPSLP